MRILTPARIGALLAAGLAAGAIGPVRSATQAVLGDTGVVDVSQSPHFSETEVSLAVDPANPDHLVIGSNRWQPLVRGVPLVGADGVVDTAVFTSQDGGRSWSGNRLGTNGLGDVPNPLGPALAAMPPELDDVGNVITADQSPAIDRRGNTYYANLGANLGDADIIVPVWRSTTAGQSWQAPSMAFSERKTLIQIDRPWLAVDNSGGPRDGTVYLTWETMLYQAYLPAVYVRSSSDQGRTWGPVVRVDQGVQRTQWDPRQYPVVGADGTLFVVYDVAPFQPPVGPQLAPITLALARSNDGGRTFVRTVVDAGVHRAPDPEEAEPYFTETIPAEATDPRRPGRVAIAWPEETAGGSRIVLRTSDDWGSSWSNRIVVAPRPAGNHDEQDHIGLAYLPDGSVAVAWRDHGCCGGTYTGSFEVVARRIDVLTAPPSLGPTVVLSGAPQLPITLARGFGAPDEYLGMVADRSGVAVAWSQIGAGGLPDAAFRRVPLSMLY